MYKQDEQFLMMKRPKCQACNKPESAVVVIGKIMVCGDCAIAWQEQQNRNNMMIFEQIRERNKE
jgi:hypothetical protein